MKMAHFGDLNQEYPVQKYFIVHEENQDTWMKALTKYNTTYNSEGRLNMAGIFTSGFSSDGGTHWVINGFKDFCPRLVVPIRCVQKHSMRQVAMPGKNS